MRVFDETELDILFICWMETNEDSFHIPSCLLANSIGLKRYTSLVESGIFDVEEADNNRLVFTGEGRYRMHVLFGSEINNSLAGRPDTYRKRVNKNHQWALEVSQFHALVEELVKKNQKNTQPNNVLKAIPFQ